MYSNVQVTTCVTDKKCTHGPNFLTEGCNYCNKIIRCLIMGRGSIIPLFSITPSHTQIMHSDLQFSGLTTKYVKLVLFLLTRSPVTLIQKILGKSLLSRSQLDTPPTKKDTMFTICKWSGLTDGPTLVMINTQTHISRIKTDLSDEYRKLQCTSIGKGKLHHFIKSFCSFW